MHFGMHDTETKNLLGALALATCAPLVGETGNVL